ncbi:polyprenyl synthetase family protein [Clostridium sp. D2Q-11]|uniref:Polyprenyl synthetase family protein n=1 Tax=Anaeromonas frigoriresistens TaxID=2683708 RepID=A0A942UXZ9_9FIRM|nr:polyprenyl synthetase family protein [Anaeromonas frigoriresistens]MBS4538879.1 polyprenyl synthetase family protein [Anaeromonas frigoriresistens]
MNSFWDKYPQLQRELEDVKEIMKKNVKTNEKYIEKPLLDLIDSGGKMLRPAFLLLSSKFGKYEKDKHQNLAAIIEMLHMATLIHDDIIDESKLRRGQTTIQSRYGKDYAVYMGDYLFSKCFMMLSEDYSMENMRKISKAITHICMGEIRQYYFRFRSDVSLKRYLKIVSGKTASLFAMSFHIGAKESECDEKMSKALGKIGYNIGMAFQIIDDILDYTAEEETLGKSIKNDLKQGFFTLPLIFALLEDNKRLEILIEKEDVTDDDVIEIINIIRSSNGLTRAKKLAVRYTERAFSIIDSLPNCESKEIIYEITEKLLKREY